MSLLQSIRAYLGWCPVAGMMHANPPVHPGFETAGAPGGTDGPDEMTIPPGWWHRYHNQLLVAAIAFSAVTPALFVLFEDVLGRLAMWPSLALVAGAALLGSLLSYRSRYARVAAGEFFRDNMTRRQRIVQYLRLPVTSVLFVVGVAYFVSGGMFDRILGLMLASSLICWTWYGLTILWERRHRTIMIAEWGSVYTLDTATEGERIC